MILALATSVVHMYDRCMEISFARAIFDSMERTDVMTWTALISAYAKRNCIDEAVNLLVLMRNSNIKPNQVITVSLVSLCTEVDALDLGKWVHAYIDKQGVELDVVLSTTLIDMYAKCGDITSAYKLFCEAQGARYLCGMQ